MKKVLLLFLAIFPIISCSTSDDNEISKKKENYVLTSDLSNISLGDKVVFKVVNSKNEIIPDIKVFDILDREVVKNELYTIKPGEFEFYAIKDNIKSNILKITVEPVFKKLTINNDVYNIDGVMMDIEVDVDIDGKVIDKVYFLEDGTPANMFQVYFANVVRKEEFNFVNLVVMVPNKSIKTLGNKVLDYGVRMLPNEVKESFITEVYAFDLKGQLIVVNKEMNSLKPHFFNCAAVNIKEKGIGIGTRAVYGEGDFIFNYKDNDEHVKIVYNGEIYFMQTYTNGERSHLLNNVLVAKKKALQEMKH